MKNRTFPITLALSILLVGCSTLTPPPKQASAPERFLCDKGEVFTLQYSPDKEFAYVDLKGIRFDLELDANSAGKRYTNSLMTLDKKEASLQLYVDRVTFTGCK